jgi:hypothetical protein
MLKRYVTLEISRNEPITAPHPALSIQYMNAVNADVFWGMSPGVWMCKDIVAERQVRQIPGGGEAVFLHVSYQFEGTDTWDIQLLDYGTYYFRNDPTAPTHATMPAFMTREGHPTAGPLNGQGGALIRNVPFTVTLGGNTVTFGVGAMGQFSLVNGQAIQVKNIGGVLPTPTASGKPLVPGTPYYIRNVVGLNQCDLTSDPAGASFLWADAGTPVNYADQPAVYNLIRPYPRLRYAPLGLPQSFNDCQ